MIIKGHLKIEESNSLVSLGSIEKIKGYCKLNMCKNLQSLGDLWKVEGALWLIGCENLKDLGNLKQVLYIYAAGSGITIHYIKKEKPELFVRCDWGRFIY